MYLGHLYPYYNIVPRPYPIWVYPVGGGYVNYPGYSAIGSAIGINNLINTGNVVGVSQIANPTVIW